MLSSTSTSSTSVAEEIRVLKNEIAKLNDKIQGLENEYPRIIYGECTNPFVLNTFSEFNAQLTMLISRLRSLENDERGKCVLTCTFAYHNETNMLLSCFVIVGKCFSCCCFSST